MLQIKILEAAYIFITTYSSNYCSQKYTVYIYIYVYSMFLTGQKRHVFYFVLMFTVFWLNVNRYTFFWHSPKRIYIKMNEYPEKNYE